MCGIFGFAKGEGSLSHFDLYRLRGAVMDLAYQNQSRGMDGTGIALISKSSVSLFKEASSVALLFGTRRFHEVIQTIDSETVVCMGHTRLATVGSVKNNHCHPFVSKDFIGAHNGHFINRETLLKKYNRSVETQVDSEAIFRVLDGEARVQDIASKLEEMAGDFALSFIERQNPGILYLVRNYERPLHAAYVAKFKILFWSSEKTHLEFALLRNGFKGKLLGIKEDYLYWADTRSFNGACRLQKLPCRIEVPRWQPASWAAEEDFEPDSAPYLFSFGELESMGFMHEAGVEKHSKIPCSLCKKGTMAGELFYDDMSGRFICESCSFDYLHEWESKRKKEEDPNDNTVRAIERTPYLW